MSKPNTLVLRLGLLFLVVAAGVVASTSGCSSDEGDFKESLGLSKEAVLSAPNALGPNEWLPPGQGLISKNGLYSMVCQSDGNLAIYRNEGSVVLWSSRSSIIGGSSPVAFCSMQGDGNFVVYRQTSPTTYLAIWNSSTAGNANSRLALQDDGIAVIFAADGQEIWSSRSPIGVLKPNAALVPYQTLTSRNGRYQLLLQGDGNLVLSRLDIGTALWTSQSGGNPTVTTLVMQGDGNLVVYKADNTSAWNSGTGGNAGAQLTLQDDGDLVITRTNGTVAWRANSAQPAGRFIFAYAGTGTSGETDPPDGNTPTQLQFSRPAAVTGTSNGSTFVLDSGNNRVIRVTSAGATSRFDGPTAASRSSRNLLQNPDFEEGHQLWSVAASTPNVWGSLEAPGAFDGNSYLTAALAPIVAPLDSEPDAEIFQEVDLPFGTDIDAGLVVLDFNGYVRSKPDPSGHSDKAQIRVEYVNAAGVIVDASKNFDSGRISSPDWYRIFHRVTVPAGARRARVRLIAYKMSEDDDRADVYFDGLSLARRRVAGQVATGLNNPLGMVAGDSSSSPADNVIIADTYNHRIVRIAQAGGTPQVLAGTGDPGASNTTLHSPRGIAKSSNGDVYIADYANHRVMRLRNGSMSVFAGTGTPGSAGNNGPATSAQLTYPSAVATTPTHVYIAEKSKGIIRRVEGSTGNISLYAGFSATGSSGYTGDGGPAVGALLRNPDGLAVDLDGGLLISDAGNYVVRRVKDGTISTLLGRRFPSSALPYRNLSGSIGDGGDVVAARFKGPRGLFVNQNTADIYLADPLDHRVRVTGCSDRDACTGAETYLVGSGSCQRSTPVNVNDNDACTTDACNPATGVVTHVPAPLEDGDDCTLDTCTTTGGIRHAPRPAGFSCNDGALCTTNDVCLAGSAVCRGTAVPIPDDNNPCTSPGYCDAVTGAPVSDPLPSGTACGAGLVCDGGGVCEAPAPVVSAPPVDPRRATPFPESIRYIYQGPGAVQTGVQANTIQEDQVALISGRLVSTLGLPLANVKVWIPTFPGYGETRTRNDGRYDIVVNSGRDLTIRFEKESYLGADRLVTVARWESKTLDDVLLKHTDTKATTVTLGSGSYQIADSSVVTDEDGVRKAVVAIQPGTQAVLRMPNGSTQALSSMTLRMTEYTVGAQGPAAMPAPIPPTTGYTYAVEVSADEAITAGAETVEFDRPIAFYLDNFIGFPVGQAVPSGYYDKVKKAWVPSPNGIVLAVTGFDGSGLPLLDATGDGVTSQAEMDAIGVAQDAPMTTAERTRIGARYAVGKSFWRVPMKHLTPWDFNWPMGPPPCKNGICPGAIGSAAGNDAATCTTKKPGSIIECETQGLGEELNVAGTPFQLNYRSTREPGYAGNRQLRLNLTGPTFHPDIEAIEVRVSIAGQRIIRSYAPSPNLLATITWDGKDGQGRPVIGSESAHVLITTVFPAVYYEPDTFAALSIDPGAGMLAADRFQNKIRFSRELRIPLLGHTPRDGWSLGGWTLSAQHFLDARAGLLYRGDGSVRRIDPDAYVVRHLAGSGNGAVYGAEGGSARNAGFRADFFSGGGGITVAPNGDVFFADKGNRVVRRIIAADGTIRTFAGVPGSEACTSSSGPGIGDGQLATAARFSSPEDVALGPDGSVYVTDTGMHNIRRIAPDGRISTIAGGTACGQNGRPVGAYSGDNELAVSAKLNFPDGIAVGADGSIYVADSVNRRIRRIDPSGTISTFAGNGQTGGGPESRRNVDPRTAPVSNVDDLALAPDGTLYMATGYELLSIQPDGILRIVNKAPFDGFQRVVDGVPIDQQSIDIGLQAIAVDRDGRVLFGDDDSQRQKPDGITREYVRAIDATGIVRSISRGRYDVPTFDGAVALQQGPGNIASLAAGLQDSVMVYDHSRIWVLERPNTIGVTACADPAAAALIPEGAQSFCFDSSGRHLSTLDSRTGQRLYTFGYSNGNLASITDSSNNQTTIVRSSDRFVITSPYNQITTMLLEAETGQNAASRYVASISDSEGQAVATYQTSGNGLLSGFIDRRGTSSAFDYDAEGMLTSDRSALNTGMDSVQALDRYQIVGGHRVDHSTPQGRVTKYELYRDAANNLIHRTTGPDLTTTVQERAPSQVTTTKYSDGTEAQIAMGPSARFGMRSPIVTSSKTTRPGGGSLTLVETQQAALSVATDPFSVTTQTTTRTISGTDLPSTTWTTVYDAANRRETTTSPLGRRVVTMFDALGRVDSQQVDGMSAVDVSYDARGRIEFVSRGLRSTQLSYAIAAPDNGYLETVTSGTESATFDRDALGRPKQISVANFITELGWDGNSNLTRVKPPGKPEHILDYSPFDSLTKYDPPAVAGITTDLTTFDQTLDRAPWHEYRQGSLATQVDYEQTTGKIDKITRGSQITDYSYYPLDSSPTAGTPPGRLAAINGPHSVNLGFKYDGQVVTQVSWSGDVTGSVAWKYNGLTQPTEEKVSVGSTSRLVGFSYDADGLLSCVSPTNCATPGTDALVISRTRLNGGVPELTPFVTATTLGNVTESRSYNEHGELTEQITTYNNGAPIVSLSYLTRDHLGRVKTASETVDSVTKQLSYTYDARGQLTDVAVDGVNNEHFAYDGNGNRTLHQSTSLGSVSPAIDDQDRYGTYGPYSFQYKPNGEVWKKTDSRTGVTWEYTYNAAGSLVAAQATGGPAITYIVDGFGRRVAKKVGASIVKRWLYRGWLNPVAELDGAGNLVAQFVYATRSNIPDFVIRADGVFRVVSDRLGSPLAAINVATGAVPFRARYTAFGEVISSTGAGWLPFGFAGGLYDADTKLVRFGARDYDASIGRWASRDPILFGGGQANLYVYVGNDPVNWSDPSGLYTEVIFWEPVGSGGSSFGHVSIDINGTSYSWGPGGMDVDGSRSFAARNEKFRSGRGLVLGVTPAQEDGLEDFLLAYGGRYNAISNNCTDPIEKGLAYVGARDPKLNALFPTGLARSLSSLAIGQTAYVGPPTSAFMPWSNGIVDSFYSMY